MSSPLHALVKGFSALALAAMVLVATAAAAFAAPAFPFGSHKQPYAAGKLRPSIVAAGVDKQTSNFYDLWKARYLKPGCAAGQYYVKADAFSGAMVVSEGQGYGMLIVAMMAGYDPAAQTLFDGLYRYKLAHPSGIEPDLMSWAQNASCVNILGNSSATDGDLDIAYALFIAHRQWGSAAAIDYLGEGRKMLAALRRANINSTTKLTNLGDWVKAGNVPKYVYATRSSDWMPGHFRAFANKEARTVWTWTLDATLSLAATMQANFAPSTGLLPDFVVATQSTPRPAPPDFLESPNDGRYNWNACRDPWRLGIDGAMSGDARSTLAARRMSQWIRARTNGNVSLIRAGYYLNGAQLVTYSDMTFIAPFAVAALNDPGAQDWLDALWRKIVTTAPTGYYPDSVKLLSMLAVSRNWIVP
jgi:endo-1,4-beta-D-glucanase Y